MFAYFLFACVGVVILGCVSSSFRKGAASFVWKANRQLTIAALKHMGLIP